MQAEDPEHCRPSLPLLTRAFHWPLQQNADLLCTAAHQLAVHVRGVEQEPLSAGRFLLRRTLRVETLRVDCRRNAGMHSATWRDAEAFAKVVSVYLLVVWLPHLNLTRGRTVLDGTPSLSKVYNSDVRIASMS